MGAESSSSAIMGNDLEQERLRAIKRMDNVIRNRVRGGIQYNMKIILKGVRNTGKSCLFQRFQGKPFEPVYVPTPEIQCATINWDFKSHEDNVKVEVWDVVDKGLQLKKNSINDSIKAKSNSSAASTSVGNPHPRHHNHTNGKNSVEVLDASIVDVYSGTHAVIFTVSPFNADSLQYVRDSFKDVPHTVPLLVLLNFKDRTGPAAKQENKKRQQKEAAGATGATSSGEVKAKEDKIVVSLVDVEDVCREIRLYRSQKEEMEKKRDVSSGSSAGRGMDWAGADVALENEHLSYNVYSFDISVYNCFGMMNLHKFLDIPFLHLKQATLMQMLRKAEEDRIASHSDLVSDIAESTVEEAYAVFERTFNEKQKQRERIEAEAKAKAAAAAAAASTSGPNATAGTAVAAAAADVVDSSTRRQASLPSGLKKQQKGDAEQQYDEDEDELDKVDFSFLRKTTSNDSFLGSDDDTGTGAGTRVDASSPTFRLSRSTDKEDERDRRKNNSSSSSSNSNSKGLSLEHHVVAGQVGYKKNDYRGQSSSSDDGKTQAVGRGSNNSKIRNSHSKSGDNGGGRGGGEKGLSRQERQEQQRDDDDDGDVFPSSYRKAMKHAVGTNNKGTGGYISENSSSEDGSSSSARGGGYRPSSVPGISKVRPVKSTKTETKAMQSNSSNSHRNSHENANANNNNGKRSSSRNISTTSTPTPPVSASAAAAAAAVVVVPVNTAAAVSAAAAALGEESLDNFLLPSDDEERSKAMNKNKIRAHLKKPLADAAAAALGGGEDDDSSSADNNNNNNTTSRSQRPQEGHRTNTFTTTTTTSANNHNNNKSMKDSSSESDSGGDIGHVSSGNKNNHRISSGSGGGVGGSSKGGGGGRLSRVARPVMKIPKNGGHGGADGDPMIAMRGGSGNKNTGGSISPPPASMDF